MPNFALDYLILVLLVSVGVLQMAASSGSLSALLLLPSPRLSSALGVFLAVGAFVWFFAVEPRNAPDTGAGLDGVEQAVLFTLGASVSLLFTLLASSLVHARKPPASRGVIQGLEAITQVSYVTVVKENLRILVSRWHELTQR